MFAPGVIAIWVGTNASIPSGWTRETTLDAKYPKGQGVEAPDITGGATTHTHTSPTHAHTLGGHTHTFTLDGCFQTNTPSTEASGPSNRIMACGHYHTGTSNDPSGGTTSSDAVTYGSVSNDPPYYGVIFIRCTEFSVFLPEDATVLWDNATVPDGFGYHNGTAATPDLRNTYLKGANTGADAGAQTGGSLTNIHNIDHSHTAQTHTHSATSGTQQGNCGRKSGGSGGLQGIDNSINHAHSFTLDAATQAINAHSGSLTTSETVEPAFRKLLAIKNIDGDPILAVTGMICMWLGELDEIPAGWSLYTQQNDKYLKVANSTAEIGDAGGSNTHTHAAQPHSHTSPSSHAHTSLSGITAHGSFENPDGGGSVLDDKNDNHALNGNTSSTQATYDAANTTANSSNNEPPYRTVSYIKLDFLSGGAMALLL